MASQEQAAMRRHLDAAAAFATRNDWVHAHCFGLLELASQDRWLRPLDEDRRALLGIGGGADRFRDRCGRPAAIVGHVAPEGRSLEEIEACDERRLLSLGLKLTACPQGLGGGWRAGRVPVALTRIDVDPVFLVQSMRGPSARALCDAPKAAPEPRPRAARPMSPRRAARLAARRVA